MYEYDAHMLSHNGYEPGTRTQGPKAAGVRWRNVYIAYTVHIGYTVHMGYTVYIVYTAYMVYIAFIVYNVHPVYIVTVPACF